MSYEENFVRFGTALRKALLEGTDAGGNEMSSANSSDTLNLNLPLVASELDHLLDENSKSSRKFARQLQEINLALYKACRRLADPQLEAAASGSKPSAKSTGAGKRRQGA